MIHDPPVVDFRLLAPLRALGEYHDRRACGQCNTLWVVLVTDELSKTAGRIVSQVWLVSFTWDQQGQLDQKRQLLGPAPKKRPTHICECCGDPIDDSSVDDTLRFPLDPRHQLRQRSPKQHPASPK